MFIVVSIIEGLCKVTKFSSKFLKQGKEKSALRLPPPLAGQATAAGGAGYSG